MIPDDFLRTLREHAATRSVKSVEDAIRFLEKKGIKVMESPSGWILLKRNHEADGGEL